MTVTIERRYATLTDVEVRDNDAGGLRFSGHAAVFNSPTDIGPFREQVAPGAFKRSIRNPNNNVALLFNHEPSTILASTRGGGLHLSEDDVGLRVDADLDPMDTDPDVIRVVSKMRRGDVTKMSFGFRVISDGWSEPDDDGRQLRTLQEVQLFDVSAVTFPAYDDTDASLHAIARGALSVAEARGIDVGLDQQDVVEHIRNSVNPPLEDTISPEERETPAQERETPEDDPAPAETPRHSPSRSQLRKRLDYLKSTL